MGEGNLPTDASLPNFHGQTNEYIYDEKFLMKGMYFTPGGRIRYLEEALMHYFGSLQGVAGPLGLIAKENESYAVPSGNWRSVIIEETLAAGGTLAATALGAKVVGSSLQAGWLSLMFSPSTDDLDFTSANALYLRGAIQDDAGTPVVLLPFTIGPNQHLNNIYIGTVATSGKDIDITVLAGPANGFIRGVLSYREILD